MIETMKAHEGDRVELTEDLPKYGLKRGQRGFVIEAFEEPGEAYDLEFEDEDGEFLGFAYSVKPEQMINIYAVAGEAFERGLVLLNEGKLFEAEREFQGAIGLKPNYISVLHNSIVRSFEDSEDWQGRINAMRFVLRVAPKYELARNNLAVAYMNYGVQKASEGNIESALYLYTIALGIAVAPDIVSDLRKNLAASHTELGIHAYGKGEFLASLSHMRQACALHSCEQTRHNLGLAYVYMALSVFNEGKLEDAIGLFERAEETGLLLPQSLSDYGATLALSGRLDEAIRAFERALELDPENTIAQRNLTLARMEAADGFITEAINTAFLPVPPIQAQHILMAA
jgi:tetratricopeptide (TPR) repeat protein